MNTRVYIYCAFLFSLVIPNHASCQEKDVDKVRIVLQTKSMNEVVIKRGVVYHTAENDSLSMDLYYPPSADRLAVFPLVVFVFGYPDTIMRESSVTKLKDMGQYVSWAQLIASSGLVALTYETLDPVSDIRGVIQYVRVNASALQIDAGRIAIWSCSGNVPTALSLLTKESNDYLKCAVFYYGVTFELPGSSKVSELATKIGFAFPAILSVPDTLRWDVPTFLVRAGLDNIPYLNETLTRFLMLAISKNSPLEFRNLPNAQHAFDVLDDNDSSRETIQRTVDFIKHHISSQL
jgi:hypothetical protein